MWSVMTTAASGTVGPVQLHARVAVPDCPLTTGVSPESRDRVRAAIINSREEYPQARVELSCNTAPGAIGSHQDLAMAVAILVAGSALPVARLADTAFVGELALDGRLRANSGIVSAVQSAARAGFARVLVPATGIADLSQMSGIEVLIAPTLAAVVEWLRNPRVELVPSLADSDVVTLPADPAVRELVELAAAGGHVLAVTGAHNSPTLVPAAYLHALLPPLTGDQRLAVAELEARTRVARIAPAVDPPLVRVHYSTSGPELFGKVGAPGPVSRAHAGVLVCADYPHFSRRVADRLASVIDDGFVHLSAPDEHVRYPARSQVVLSGHDCVCGRSLFATAEAPCGQLCWRWPRGEVDERVDVRVRIEPGATVGLPRSSLVQIDRVAAARVAARGRWSALGVHSNAEVPFQELHRSVAADRSVVSAVERLVDDGPLTPRQVCRVLAVAWTLCDMRGDDAVTIDDIDRAVQLRCRCS